MTQPPSTPGALVLFSGGQDSLAALAWALRRFARVETIGFHYGQRHNIEMTVRAACLDRLRQEFGTLADPLGEDHIVDLAGLGAISETSLTRDTEIQLTQDGLPDTFVPGRNLAFFVFAAAIGFRRGLMSLVGGMCEADFSGYPDCRADTLAAMADTLRLGLDRPFEIVTPLMHIDKAGTWALAGELGGDDLVELMRSGTHTCYLGVRETLHDWGYGCGTCPACALRAKGYHAWRSR